MDWKKDAVAIENVEIDIGFVISSSLYIGPNNFTRHEFDTLREEIYQPKIPLVENRALSRDVIGCKSELIKYYRDLIRLSQKHEKRLFRTTFCIQPWVYSMESDIPIGFYWYWHFDECEYLFKALLSEKEGRIFWDEEQGWEMFIHLFDGKLYFHQSDPQDAAAPVFNIVIKKFDNRELLTRLEQTREIIAKLTKEFGVDRWSRHIY
jgi:hypothetical protein